MEPEITRDRGAEIPPDELGGIIDDLISIAEQLAEGGDDVNAGLINNIVDQLMLYMPD
ncbi:MAG: hypothetical protein ACRDZ3_22415 [Acidimicrobiia bacterium]